MNKPWYLVALLLVCGSYMDFSSAEAGDNIKRSFKSKENLEGFCKTFASLDPILQDIVIRFMEVNLVAQQEAVAFQEEGRCNEKNENNEKLAKYIESLSTDAGGVIGTNFRVISPETEEMWQKFMAASNVLYDEVSELEENGACQEEIAKKELKTVLERTRECMACAVQARYKNR